MHLYPAIILLDLLTQFTQAHASITEKKFRELSGILAMIANEAGRVNYREEFEHDLFFCSSISKLFKTVVYMSK